MSEAIALNLVQTVIGLNFMAAVFVFSRHTDSAWLQRKRYLLPAVLLPYVTAVLVTHDQVLWQRGIQIVCLLFIFHTLLQALKESPRKIRKPLVVRKQEGKRRRV